MNNEEKKNSPSRQFRKDASLFGGVRSLASTTRSGGAVIKDGVRIITDATQNSIKPARQESFEQAMQRLGVSEKYLPIIHNQLLVQIYLTFFMAIIAVTSGVNLIFNNSLMPATIAFLIAFASVAKAIQSSIQCEFIRQKKLGIHSQWWKKPSIWFPDRMDAVVPMKEDDPLRSPQSVNELVGAARKNFMFAAAMGLLCIVVYFIFSSIGLTLLTLTVMTILLVIASNISFEIFKRRKGYECDPYPWIIEPKSWVPSYQSINQTKGK